MKEGVAFNTMSKSHKAPGTGLNHIQPNKEGNPPKRPESPPPIIICGGEPKGVPVPFSCRGDVKGPVPLSCRGDEKGMPVCDEKGMPVCDEEVHMSVCDEGVHMSVYSDMYYCYERLSPSTSPTGDKQPGDLESEIHEINKLLRNCDLDSCCGGLQHSAVKRRRNPVSEAGPEKNTLN